MPPLSLSGVPVMRPVVPFSEANGGKDPAVTLNVGAGEPPMVVTWKEPGWFTMKVALDGVVKLCGICVTVSAARPLLVASGRIPLLTTAWKRSPFIGSVTLVTVSVAVVAPL